MLKNIFVINLILLLLFISEANSQKQLDQFYNAFEELSDNNISAIIQDKSGFMWFATKTGLCRYDGNSYKNYIHNPSDTTSLSLNWITDIAQDDEGNLWLATYGGGLNFYDRKTDKFRRFMHKTEDVNTISNNNILKLFIDNDKTLWIATEDGLNVYNKTKNSFIRYTHNNSNISSSVVSAISQDDNGLMWIGTMGGGICIYDKALQHFECYKNEPNNIHTISDNNIRCITKDSRGTLWIGTMQGGLNKAIRNGKTISFKRYLHDIKNPASLANNSILSIYEDSKRNLWIGTENGGLELFNKTLGQFIHHQHKTDNPTSIISNSIWSIHEDMAGGLWFGTFNRGISKWDPNKDKFRYYPLKPTNNNGDQSSTVTSFYEIEAGKVLIGTDGSGYFVWEMKSNTFTQIVENPSNPKSLGCNVVLAMESDIKNQLWMGTWGNGIIVSKPNKPLEIFDRIYSFENIFSIYKDDNTMYLGTWGTGLRVITDNWKRFNQYTPIEGDTSSISSVNIFTVKKDSYNRLWVGTLNGLNLAITQKDSTFKFKKYLHHPNDSTSISSNTILAVYEDTNRTLWIGTDFGLNKFDSKNDRFLRIQNPLIASRSIKSIREDGNGNLWMGTETDLLMYNPRTNRVESFDKSDGVKTKGLSVGASIKLSDNSLLFGGKNGFIRFQPDSVKRNSFIPPVQLVDFKIFNKSVIHNNDGIFEKNILLTKEIKLSHKQSIFSIEFVALNFSHPEKNQYAYMLDGLENEWNYVGNQRMATYTNLTPGDYTFLVKASNNDGVWNETPVKLHIKVNPPFWGTIWFRILLGSLLVWIIYLLYVARVKKVKRQMEIQERLFKSKQIEAETEIIKLQKDKLDSELEYTNKELASITMNIMQKNERMISLRDQLLDVISTTDSTTQRKLKTITREIEEDLESEKKWDRFESNFDMIHDNFIKRFTELYPKITHNDLKMCAFIRMNLSNKEIANLLNITLRSVESSRYRIRKKMELDSEINLNDFIMRF